MFRNIKQKDIDFTKMVTAPGTIRIIKDGVHGGITTSYPYQSNSNPKFVGGNIYVMEHLLATVNALRNGATEEEMVLLEPTLKPLTYEEYAPALEADLSSALASVKHALGITVTASLKRVQETKERLVEGKVPEIDGSVKKSAVPYARVTEVLEFAEQVQALTAAMAQSVTDEVMVNNKARIVAAEKLAQAINKLKCPFGKIHAEVNPKSAKALFTECDDSVLADQAPADRSQTPTALRKLGWSDDTFKSAKQAYLKSIGGAASALSDFVGKLNDYSPKGAHDMYDVDASYHMYIGICQFLRSIIGSLDRYISKALVYVIH